MARDPRTPDCGIKGCARAVRKGYLCRKHYDLLPDDTGIRVYMAGLMAQSKAVDAYHRKQLAYVRKVLSGKVVSA